MYVPHRPVVRSTIKQTLNKGGSDAGPATDRTWPDGWRDQGLTVSPWVGSPPTWSCRLSRARSSRPEQLCPVQGDDTSQSPPSHRRPGAKCATLWHFYYVLQLVISVSGNSSLVDAVRIITVYAMHIWPQFATAIY